jgi:hypothetical protein
MARQKSVCGHFSKIDSAETRSEANMDKNTGPTVKRRLDACGGILRRGCILARRREGWAYDEIARGGADRGAHPAGVVRRRNRRRTGLTVCLWAMGIAAGWLPADGIGGHAADEAEALSARQTGKIWIPA